MSNPDLGAITDPAIVIPGDPDALAAAAAELRQHAQSLHHSADTHHAQRDLDWQGQHADDERTQLRDAVNTHTAAANASSAAADALEQLREAIVLNRDRAAAAIAQHQRGLRQSQADLASWKKIDAANKQRRANNQPVQPLRPFNQLDRGLPIRQSGIDAGNDAQRALAEAHANALAALRKARAQLPSLTAISEPAPATAAALPAQPPSLAMPPEPDRGRLAALRDELAEPGPVELVSHPAIDAWLASRNHQD